LFGIAKRLNTREETFKVIINTLKNLHFATIDAAFGVTSLVTLYLIKWGLQWAGNRYVKFRRAAFFLSCFRHGFVISESRVGVWWVLPTLGQSC
jgi:sodium-independent sulfate anion transporter 11